MKVKMHLGYWTVFSGDKPLVQCSSVDRAIRLMLGCLR